MCIRMYAIHYPVFADLSRNLLVGFHNKENNSLLKVTLMRYPLSADLLRNVLAGFQFVVQIFAFPLLNSILFT